MPGFVTRVRAWQAASRLSAQATTLLGFSQGGIMALESTQRVVKALVHHLAS